jgi:regulator of protease activity HflC (stomatin/prohibitin superfamily)
MRTYNLTVFVAACVGVVIFLYNPTLPIVLIIAAVLLFAALLWVIAMRPVHEPDRAVVYRLAQFHHIAGPGFIFLVPTLDRIEGVLDMTPQEIVSEVPQIATADGGGVRVNIEITWRYHPDVLQGRVNPRLREMIMMTEERRKKLVEETMMLTARQLVSSYTTEQLGSPATREVVMTEMTDFGNERLSVYGILIDRVFWRGSPFPGKLAEAMLEGRVRLQHTETLIKMLEAFRQRLPEMPAEEIMALDAWLNTFGGGGRPPTPRG